MKLAISNIAWDTQDDSIMVEHMHDCHFTGVEIAPTKIWETPTKVSRSDATAYRRKWAEHDIEICALQALLYGRPDLTIFQSSSKRVETLRYLCQVVELGALLGAQSLIFGSPVNRTVGQIDHTVAKQIAIDFFGTLGRKASGYGINFCIEPNPVEYQCDYINTADEALDLVNQTNQNGFALHLDAAAMTLNKETVEQTIPKSISKLSHFHISQPDLQPIDSSTESQKQHIRFAKALRDSNFNNWCSVEMRKPNELDYVDAVKKAMETTALYYLSDRRSDPIGSNKN